MLRTALNRILDEYMDARAGGDDAFAGHRLATYIRGDARDTVLAAAKSVSANDVSLIAKGSAGDVNRWTHTPWIAVMDKRDTDSVREGVYVVYLVATDCEKCLPNNQPRLHSAVSVRDAQQGGNGPGRASASRRRDASPLAQASKADVANH